MSDAMATLLHLLENLLDGEIILDLCFRFQTQQFEELILQHDVDELLGIERVDRLQRLNEIDHIVPLPVQDQLSQEENVLRERSIDDAYDGDETQMYAGSMR